MSYDRRENDRRKMKGVENTEGKSLYAEERERFGIHNEVCEGRRKL